MSFTVAECISDARDRHRTFSKAHTTDRTLLRRINRFSRELYFMTHKRDPDLFIAVHNIPFPLASFAAGFDLTTLSPVMALPSGGTLNHTVSTLKLTLTIVPFANRFAPGQGPAAYMEADTLKFVGQDTDWADITSVDFYYIPEPTEAAAETANVDLPDVAQNACGTELAKFMALRGPQDKTMPTSEFRIEAAEAKQEYLDEIGRRRRAKTFVVREAWALLPLLLPVSLGALAAAGAA